MTVNSNEGADDFHISSYERKQSIDKIIEAIPMNPTASDTIRYSWSVHAKRIENHIYKEARSDSEYFRLINEHATNLQNELKEKCKQFREQPYNMARVSEEIARDFDDWRCFYSQASIRRAVVNGFIKDVCSNIEIPLQYKYGLRLGVEQTEMYAFKCASSKIDYFHILDDKKTVMTSELISYFRNGN